MITPSTDTTVDVLDMLAQAAALRTQADTSSRDMNAIAREQKQRDLTAAQLVKDAVAAVRGGATTGDLALDIAIVAGPESHRAQNRARMQSIIDALAPLGGQLVIASHHTIYMLGIIPDNGRPFLIPAYSDLAQKYFPTNSSADYIAVGGNPSGTVDRYVCESGDYSASFRCMQSVPDITSEWNKLIAGNEAVTAWYLDQDLEMQFKFWVVSRLIGRPLKATPELQADIRRRREEMIVKVIDAREAYKQLTDLLARFQRNPALALDDKRRQYLGSIEYTNYGVIIDFGLEPDITKARQALVTLVENALSHLLMADNPTVLSAAAILGIKPDV